MNGMKYKVTKFKNDNEVRGEVVKAGTRILIGYNEGEEGFYLISWQEMTTKEVNEEFEQNECFGFEGTVYTEKGNRVDLFSDIETGECFFKVTRLQGAK